VFTFYSPTTVFPVRIKSGNSCEDARITLHVTFTQQKQTCMKWNFYPGKKLLLLSACVWAMTVATAVAQSTVTIGTGTSSSYLYGPYYRSSASSSFDYSRYAYLYTAAELGIPAGATITKVEWNKKNGTIIGNNVFNIFMKNTSATSLASGTSWGTLTTGATAVYTSSTQSFTTTGWVPFTLMTPFEYTGGNLVVMTDHEKTGTASGANNFYYHTANGYGIGFASSSAPNNSTTLSTSSYGNKRPNIRITWEPPCPVEITLQPVNGTVCSNDDLSFYVKADSTQAYRWQHYSGNNWINLTDNATYTGTATDSLVVRNVAVSMDNFSYRVIVTNTARNCSEESDSANISVIASTPAFIVLTAGPDSNICQDEQITFYTAYSNGGNTPRYRWLKNSVEIPGEESATFITNTLADGDVIQAKLISSAQCVQPVNSNPIKVNIDPVLSTSVNVTVYSAGDDYIFTAIPHNGGTNPEYYWYINNVLVEGQHGPVFTTQNLLPHDRVHVDMKSSLACVDPVVVSGRNITTGINTVAGNNEVFTLSPNPNTGQFVIKGAYQQQLMPGSEINVTITNITGEIIYNRVYMSAGSDISLPVKLDPNIPNGMYQVNISIDDEVSGLRFILNR